MKWGLGRKAQWLAEKLNAERLSGVAQLAKAWRQASEAVLDFGSDRCVVALIHPPHNSGQTRRMSFEMAGQALP